MTEIEFIKDGPVLDNSIIRARELESSRARSFAARVSHAKNKRSMRLEATDQLTEPGFSNQSARSDQEPSLVEDAEGQSMHLVKYLSRAHSIHQRRKRLAVSRASMVIAVSNQLWKTSEECLAYDHWLSVTAPLQAQCNASIGSNFWQAIVPQMAQVFLPVKNVLLALEFIDLPAFPGETLAERREKTISFYSKGIRYLYKSSWPRICVIMVSILAYLLELRWIHTDQARMHLRSCQRLLADADQNPQNSKGVSEFVHDIHDTVYHGNNFLRLHSRVQILEKSMKCSLPEYGIDTMPDSFSTQGNLKDYLTRFQQSVDKVYAAYMPSKLDAFDVVEAFREYGRWDDMLYRLHQQRKIGNTTATVSLMLSYIHIFLLPYAQDGVFGVRPDPLVWDHILQMFRDQLLRSLDPQERQDVNMVVRLGIATILRFPHETRHPAEIESIRSLLALGELTAPVLALHTISSYSDPPFEMTETQQW